jgi:hypothetical protein
VGVRRILEGAENDASQIPSDFSIMRNAQGTMNKPITTQLPHTFKRIRLEIARSRDFPSGSAQHGYEFVAPLDRNGHIDPTLWRTHRDNCRVRRFWGDEEEIGHLLHKPGGPEHAHCVFDFDDAAEHNDESGYRFGAHTFAPGEYVSIRDEAGELHTFRVRSVSNAT